MSSSTSVNSAAFWERMWRTSGIQSAALFIVAYFVHGYQPDVGASAETLAAFYDGGNARVLIAAVLSGFAVLNLLWFAASIRTTLAEIGQDGWGAAASAAVGGLFLLLLALGTAPAYSVIGSAEHGLQPVLNDFSWTAFVVSSFPRAMLIMAGTFGLWRAKFISDTYFAAGLTALVLVLLGGTTWLSDGFWSPSGIYSRFVSPAVGLLWVFGMSRALLTRAPATRAAW